MHRNRKTVEKAEGSWHDWKCRKCRGIGPEGRQHRQKKEKEPKIIDLTLSSDSEPETTPAGGRLNQAQSAALPGRIVPATASIDLRPVVEPQELNINQDTLNLPQHLHMHHHSTPTLDDLRLEDVMPAPPPFPFPEPTPFDRPLEQPDIPQPSTHKPPALRTHHRSIVGERMLNVTVSSRVVKMIGLKRLAACGWRCEGRDVQSVSAEPEPRPQYSKIEKGKGRAPGERPRDWTPLVRRELEMARLAEQEALVKPDPLPAMKREVYLVPPTPAKVVDYIQDIHPPRQDRKRRAKVREMGVKQEEQDFSLG
ncbi:hypothetical protein BDV93DRAFT_506446 [Ceratobasidium sp. AG-I]|nr:hypothetical protein BDV93DRAFT_506446 [Ceratobasidium sp. AG-I]